MAVTDKINLLGTEYEIGAKAENVTYSGQVPNVGNVKAALDSLQTQVNNSGGGGSSAGGTEEHHLRVFSYNIGHFAMGGAANSTISPDNADQTVQEVSHKSYANANYGIQLKRWKHRLASVGADVMFLSEYSGRFASWTEENQGETVSIHKNTADDVLDGYPYIRTGSFPNSGWITDAIVGMNKLVLSGNAYGYEYVDVNGNYTYNGKAPAACKVLHSTLSLAGKTVHLFCVHLLHNGNRSTSQEEANYHARIEAQIPNLVSLYDDYDYIIMCGDFNTEGAFVSNPTLADYAAGVNEFQPFITKGFTCLNTPTKPIYTFPSLGVEANMNNGMPYRTLDNIIVKGFEIVSSELINDGTLTDHCGLVADLKMIVQDGQD